MQRRKLRGAIALVVGVGVGFGAAVAAPAAWASAGSGTASGANYYVDSAVDCSDSGPGSLAEPFCTIQAGADAATAGSTVFIAAKSGSANAWGEDVTVPHSGTASAPITFEPYQGAFFTGDEFNSPGFKLDSVKNIVISGLESSGGDLVTVENSTGIVIENSELWADTENVTAVSVTGSSSVTIERSELGGTTNSSTAVSLGPGSSGVVADNIFAQSGPAIVADGTVAGTDIVANTIDWACGPGIEVTGTGAQADVENNVIDNLTNNGETIGCDVGGPTTLAGIDIGGGAGSGVTEQYNTIANDGGDTPPYIWNGTQYRTVADYQTASGKGASDDVETTVALGIGSMPADPDVIGTANPAAPGQPATDFYGQSPVGATPDRGALQYQPAAGGSLEIAGAETQVVSANLDLQGIPWGETGDFTFSWGDGTADTTVGGPATVDFDARNEFSATHSYTDAGTYTASVTFTDTAGTFTYSQTFTTGGSTYLPQTPRRVLDTRHGTGAPEAAVAPNHALTVNVTQGATGIPVGDAVTAAVVNLTVTQPSANGYLTAYPGGTTRPTSSNVNFSRDETVANLATVRVDANGNLNLYNGSSGTTELIADVEGYYVAGSAGAGYVPVTPKRLLDTRSGIGAAKAPVGKDGQVTLQVAGAGPVPATGVTAVALNVTAVSPTAAGYVTVWPDGSSRPATSNLNYGAGQTVPNLVIVKVPADGKIDLYSGSGGSVQLLADVEGYYTTAGGDAFVPVNPVREIDTRTGLGGLSTLPAKQAQNWTAYDDLFTYYSGVVLNVTATDGTANGDIRVYPGAASLPTTSNLNYRAGQNIPNLVMVGVSPDASGNLDFYNDSVGTVDLVADLFGYFA